MAPNLDLRAGMWVLSVDGQKLGRIARLEGDGFEVVEGWRAPRGFRAGMDEVLSVLRGEVFLRQRYRDYVERYRPWERRAPEPHVRNGRAGRRFFLLRRNEARW